MNYRRLRTLAIAFVILLGGLGCGRSSKPVSSFCLIARPFEIRASDTEATKLWGDDHNAAGEVLCGWK
tara:strand:- start:429 stop:632 length:204 start_codon:yes stop_codon:yes gene_type:complete